MSLINYSADIEWRDPDKIRRMITEDIPPKVAADPAYQNAIKNNDKQNARIEHNNALKRIMLELLSDHTQFYGQFSDNLSFNKWVADSIFSMTYPQQHTRDLYQNSN